MDELPQAIFIEYCDEVMAHTDHLLSKLKAKLLHTILDFDHGVKVFEPILLRILHQLHKEVAD